MHEPLSPAKMTSASLMCFFERGFTINPFQAHIPVEAKKTKRINFWSCTKDDQKYVLFDPCRDEVPDDEKETLTMISILDMQPLAQHFISQGFTCIIPVAEHAPSSLRIVNYSLGSRMHWVLLLWSQNELRFFDPKSSNLYVAKYDNNIFKRFAILACKLEDTPVPASFFSKKTNSAWVEKIKEPHVQTMLDISNCGYYCVFRIAIHLDQPAGTLLSQSSEFYTKYFNTDKGDICEKAEEITAKLEGVPAEIYTTAGVDDTKSQLVQCSATTASGAPISVLKAVYLNHDDAVDDCSYIDISSRTFTNS